MTDVRQAVLDGIDREAVLIFAGVDPALMVRFWRKVDVPRNSEACWRWTGVQNGSGYGRIRHGRRLVFAHRVAWKITHGPIPSGLFVCHRCDVGICVNPAHLFLGTAAENNADCVRKRRHAHGDTHWSRTNPGLRPRGTRHGRVKLSESDVMSIRDSRGPLSEAARRFGVSISTVSSIRHGKTWTHLRERAAVYAPEVPR